MSHDSPAPDEEAGPIRWHRAFQRVGQRRRAGLTPWRKRRLRRMKALRGWGRSGRTRRIPSRISRLAKISVVVYLDTDSEQTINEVLARVELVRSLAGYGGRERNISVQRGSIFRRSFAAVRKGLSSNEVKDRLVKVERAVELVALDRHQATYDQTEANAVSALIASTRDVTRVCIRIGSILFVKFPSPSGEPTVIVRNVTQAEIRAFERYPEIQRQPEKTVDLLASIMDSCEAASTIPPT